MGKHEHRRRSNDRETSSDNRSRSRSSAKKLHKRKRSRTSSRERRCRRSSSRSPVARSPKLSSPPPAPIPGNPEVQAEINRLKAEKKRQKELMKATETAEEKRARRLAKKAAKERKRRAELGWDDEHFGYSNADNPFGDQKLLEPFVWEKKLDADQTAAGIDPKRFANEQYIRKEGTRSELERVKVRRVKREQEQAEIEAEREQIQRERESEFYRVWAKQEETFHLTQARMRSEFRIDQGRAKPIDVLAHYINPDSTHTSDELLSLSIESPLKYLDELNNKDELEDLLADIQLYMQLEKEDEDHLEFWQCIETVVKNRLDRMIEATTTKGRSAVHEKVKDSVTQIYTGKPVLHLQKLRTTIERKLRSGEKGIDVAYWETLLSGIKVEVDRRKLADRHEAFLELQKRSMMVNQGIENKPLFPSADTDNPSTSAGLATSEVARPTENEAADDSKEQEDDTEMDSDHEKNEEEADEQKVEVYTEEQAMDDYENGLYSPPLISEEAFNADQADDQSKLGQVVYSAEDDEAKLAYMRSQVQQTGTIQSDADSQLMIRAREGMNDDEAQFSVEAPIEQQKFLWADLYKPRKPKFFNRVHTGYEWSKYNQTHYDIDNPPPKIVQGYKFNIFYPDLIDKTVPPSFDLLPDPENADFAILRFKAGPPYEDIAFKIIRREWQVQDRKGFRCQFVNGVFQLWFHFKKYKYRR